MADATGYRCCLGDTDDFYKTNTANSDIADKHHDIGTIYICDQCGLAFDDEQYRSRFLYHWFWNCFIGRSSIDYCQWILG